jgi:hypothetical protein
MRNPFKNKKRESPIKMALHAAIKNLSVKAAHLQNKLAGWLTLKSEKLTMSKKKLVLGIYCFCFGGLSILIIIQSAFFHSSGQVVIPKSFIPSHIGKAGKDIIAPAQAMSFQTYQELRHLMQLVDSLSALKDGQRKFDSMLQADPSLLDTIQFIKKNYLSNHK